MSSNDKKDSIKKLNTNKLSRAEQVFECERQKGCNVKWGPTSCCGNDSQRKKIAKAEPTDSRTKTDRQYQRSQ